MRAKIYPLLEDSVSEGIALGYARAYKHNDSPSPVQLTDAIFDCIMEAICERFEFDDTTAI